MPRPTASRNPFRTRQLEQLLFRSPADGSPFDWPAFFARLHTTRVRERGAIVGPHGTGKTTFLVELKRRLEDRGRSVVMLFTNRDSDRRLSTAWANTLRAVDEPTMVIVDGYDALTLPARFLLRRVHRPRGGLLVTAHRRCALPTLMETRTSPELAKLLVDDLCASSGGPALPEGVSLEQMFHRCGGNLRELFRRLYAVR